MCRLHLLNASGSCFRTCARIHVYDGTHAAIVVPVYAAAGTSHTIGRDLAVAVVLVMGMLTAVEGGAALGSMAAVAPCTPWMCQRETSYLLLR